MPLVETIGFDHFYMILLLTSVIVLQATEHLLLFLEDILIFKRKLCNLNEKILSRNSSIHQLIG